MAGRSFLAGLAALACALGALASGASASPHAASGAARAGFPKPKVKWDPIPYGHDRRKQMAKYSKRHYGKREWRLGNPRAIVLHYTAGGSYKSVWNTFASNAPNLGERPGVCAQFVVGKDGTIHQLTRMYVRCRHTVGLNHVSFGIEMVQADIGSGSEEAILHRRKQIRAATRLVAYLKERYGIRMRNLIGHAMANDSPLFKDLEGWRNDHGDWPKSDVKKFRKKVVKVLRKHRSGGSRREGGGGKARIAFGRSVDGRRLVARRIGPPHGKRTALVVGEVHGDEEAGRGVVRELRRHREGLGDATIWTVSSVNPDGHAADRRTNAHGVDLNRNFSVGWDGSEPRGSGYYAGPHPFSEPESKALRDLWRRLRPDVTVLYHQPWDAVLAPCSGPIALQRLYSRISGIGVDRCRGEGLPGTMTRWMNKRSGTSFVVEFQAGKLSAKQVRRNARAVRRVAAR
jgi:hypothetical protein